MTTPGSNGPDQQPGGGAPGWGQPPAGSPGGYSPPPPPPSGATPPGGSPQGQYPQQPGGFPQGQYQQPGGFPQGQYQPQPGGAPYPPQGGAPYPPGAGAYGAPPKKGPPKWLIPVIAGVVLVAAALALFAFFGNNDPEVGDCFDQSALQSSEGDVEVVDCGSDDAAAKIVGIDERKLTADEYQSDPTTCQDVSGWDTQLWVGPLDDEDAEGTIYCLQTLG